MYYYVPCDILYDLSELSIPFQKLSKRDSKNNLKWMKNNCNFFHDFLPDEAIVEEARIDKRILVINRCLNLSHYFYVIKEGNMFELTGYELDENTWSAISPKSKIIHDIFAEGDVITDFHMYFNHYLLYEGVPIDYSFLSNSAGIIAGLPWERKITPIQVIRIEHSVFTHFVQPKSQEILAQYRLQALRFLLFKNFWDKVRLTGQLTNSAKAKISAIIYQCFYGEFPINWWQQLDNKEFGAKPRQNSYVLKKPRCFIKAFILQERAIAMLTGLSQKQIENTLLETLQRDKYLSEYLSIKSIIGTGSYEFAIKIPEGITKQKDIKDLQHELYGHNPVSIVANIGNYKVTADEIILSYVVDLLKKNILTL